jgi:hypothetical protein
VAWIEPVRDIAHRFGGSHAQRDVLTLTLIEAAIRSGRRERAEHYRRTNDVQVRWALGRSASSPGNSLAIWRLLMRERLTTANGITVYYATWGSGPPLVLVHGAFSDDSTKWEFVKRFEHDAVLWPQRR